MRIGIGIGIPGVAPKVPFSPGSLGAITSHFIGDSAAFARTGSVVYSSVTDQGSIANAWNPATNLHPIATVVGTREAPTFNAGRRFLNAGTAASWAYLNASATVRTLGFRFFAHTVANNGRVLSTVDAATGIGAMFYLDSGGKFRAIISDGVGSTSMVSTTNVALGWNTAFFVKDGTSLTLVLNGDTPVTATLTTPSASNPPRAAIVGATSTGTSPLHGIVAEIVIHETALNSAQRSLMSSYLADQWSGTPAYCPLKEAADLACWYRGDQVALDTGIDEMFDESGHNNHLVQATAVNQPALTASAVNGLPGSTGDGSADFLRVASFTQGDIAQPSTHYTVLKVNNWVASRHLASTGTDATTRQDLFTASSGAAVSVFAGTILTATIPGATTMTLTGVAGVTRAVFNGASSSLRAQFDGFAETTATGAAGAQPRRGETIHALTTGSSPSASTVCERMIFAGAAGSATSASDENDGYLRAKYAVAA